jgi:tripartite-type tricarboxylate transporter receptor subunit TctC
MELFKLETGAILRDIPYRRGIAPPIIDLLAGRVQTMAVNISDALPHIRSGGLRALGVTIDKRIPQLPDVPALAESIPGFYSATWYAMMAPPRTPSEITDKLSVAINEILHSPEISEKLREQSMIIAGISPKETERFVQAEIARWRAVITKAGIKPD